MHASLREREGYAARVIEIDTEVKKIIATLTARGFKSPYLRNYVAAHINPVRFHKTKKGETKPPMPIGQALLRMAAAAKNFSVTSVSNKDLAWVAVGAGGVTSPRLTRLRSVPRESTARIGPRAAPSASMGRAHTSANSRPAG